MQFKVPQFLDIEDKIFGPFTFRQFVYLAGGGGICFVLLKLMGIWFGGIPIIIVIALSLALAFYRPNNKPFVDMLQSSIQYFMQGKLYIWKKEYNKNSKPDDSPFSKTPDSVAPPEIKLSNGKLRDLAWSLDVLDLNKK